MTEVQAIAIKKEILKRIATYNKNGKRAKALWLNKFIKESIDKYYPDFLLSLSLEIISNPFICESIFCLSEKNTKEMEDEILNPPIEIELLRDMSLPKMNKRCMYGNYKGAP